MVFDRQMAAQRIAEASGKGEEVNRIALLPAAGINIPVHVHVLRAGLREDEGNIPDSLITSQLKVQFNLLNWIRSVP